MSIQGGCPTEKDNAGCFFPGREPELRPAEVLTAPKEFCGCTFAWKNGNGGKSLGKTLPAIPTAVERVYAPVPCTAESAAAIPCTQVLGAYTVIFDRAYYLSGAYGLWRPVLIAGLGALGSFLYYFFLKALNGDLDPRCRELKTVQSLCGIFTVAVALAIHLWSATLAWFTAYLGPRMGAEGALAAVTAYQEDLLVAILPMYLPMVLAIGIHFALLLAGRTRYPRWMLAFHPVTWNLLLVLVPDIAQAMQVPAATWMSVMSQSSTNTAITLWCVAAALYGQKHLPETAPGSPS